MATFDGETGTTAKVESIDGCPTCGGLFQVEVRRQDGSTALLAAVRGQAAANKAATDELAKLDAEELAKLGS